MHNLLTGVKETNKKARNAFSKVKNLISKSDLCGPE